VFEELTNLGRAIGANGFVTISTIEASDGSGRYYFEADMRPSVWADCSTFFGDDPAASISRWFSEGTCLTPENVARQVASAPVTIPWFLRMAVWELLTNRYSVWRYLPLGDTRVAVQMWLRAGTVRFAKAITSRKMQKMLGDWVYRPRSTPGPR